MFLRLQNLPDAANSMDIRKFFHDCDIPAGGIQIVGGPNDEAYIWFTTTVDLVLALEKNGQHILGEPVRLVVTLEGDEDGVAVATDILPPKDQPREYKDQQRITVAMVGNTREAKKHRVLGQIDSTPTQNPIIELPKKPPSSESLADSMPPWLKAHRMDIDDTYTRDCNTSRGDAGYEHFKSCPNDSKLRQLSEDKWVVLRSVHKCDVWQQNESVEMRDIKCKGSENSSEVCDDIDYSNDRDDRDNSKSRTTRPSHNGRQHDDIAYGDEGRGSRKARQQQHHGYWHHNTKDSGSDQRCRSGSINENIHFQLDERKKGESRDGKKSTMKHQHCDGYRTSSEKGRKLDHCTNTKSHDKHSDKRDCDERRLEKGCHDKSHHNEKHQNNRIHDKRDCSVRVHDRRGDERHHVKQHRDEKHCNDRNTSDPRHHKRFKMERKYDKQHSGEVGRLDKLCDEPYLKDRFERECNERYQEKKGQKRRCIDKNSNNTHRDGKLPHERCRFVLKEKGALLKRAIIKMRKQKDDKLLDKRYHNRQKGASLKRADIALQKQKPIKKPKQRSGAIGRLDKDHFEWECNERYQEMKDQNRRRKDKNSHNTHGDGKLPNERCCPVLKEKGALLKRAIITLRKQKDDMLPDKRYLNRQKGASLKRAVMALQNQKPKKQKLKQSQVLNCTGPSLKQQGHRSLNGNSGFPTYVNKTRFYLCLRDIESDASDHGSGCPPTADRVYNRYQDADGVIFAYHSWTKNLALIVYDNERDRDKAFFHDKSAFIISLKAAHQELFQIMRGGGPICITDTKGKYKLLTDAQAHAMGIEKVKEPITDQNKYADVWYLELNDLGSCDVWEQLGGPNGKVSEVISVSKSLTGKKKKNKSTTTSVFVAYPNRQDLDNVLKEHPSWRYRTKNYTYMYLCSRPRSHHIKTTVSTKASTVQKPSTITDTLQVISECADAIAALPKTL